MLKRILTICVLLALAVLLVVCKSKRNQPGTDDGTDTASKPAYNSTGDEGMITGTVSFNGTPPTMKKMDMSQDPYCLSAAEDKSSEDVLITGGKLANVFVYLKGGPADKHSFGTASETVILDQKGCRYIPHVFGIQTGQMLNVLNSDQTGHNVHPSPKVNKEWNKAQNAGQAPIEAKFNRPELLIPVKCNQHPWMKAYIGVLGHPFYAVSAKDGSYSIKDVPPGDYTLVFWHETFGEQTQAIKVGAKETKKQDIEYKGGTAYAPTSLRVEPAFITP